jgi:hypothetical protein
MASLSTIIDIHSHPILPFGQGAPVGPGPKQPDWSVEGALSYMEEHDISACVLSDPDSANHATGQEARDIARRINETLADIVSRYPGRFGALATLPGQDADGAVAEIVYALDTLKMDGVGTSTSINDVYLGEPQFDPWLEELNRRGPTLFVHPTFTKAAQTLLNGLNPSVLEFMFDTTRMIANMVADVERYPAFSEADLQSLSYGNAGRLFPALKVRIEQSGEHNRSGRAIAQSLSAPSGRISRRRVALGAGLDQ